MPHVFLVHWKDDEIDAYAAPLRDAGWRVDTESDDGNAASRAMRDATPDVVAISLRRQPSHGLQLARHLQEVTSLADVPVVFFDGDDEASGRALDEVDGAVHVGWEELPRVLAEVTDAPPA